MPGNGVDAWMEESLIAISTQGGSDVLFTGLTETMQFSGAEKDFDDVALVNGGRISKWSAQKPVTVTLEMYPLEAGTATGTTATGVFDLLEQSGGGSQPLSITNTRVRTPVRIVMMWTDSSSQMDPAAATASGDKALRITYADGYVISANPDFSDGVLKFQTQLKFAPFDKSGASNFKYESTDGSGTNVIPALSPYTTINKF